MWKTFLKPYRVQAICGFLFKLLEAFFELLVPFVMASMIDQGIMKNNQDYIWKTGIILFLLAFLGYACALVCQYFASLVSQKFGTDVRNATFHAIQSFDRKDLDEMGPTTLLTRMTHDINQLQLAVAMSIRLISRTPFLIIGSLVMAWRIDASMALIFFVTMIILTSVVTLIVKSSVGFYHRIQKQLDKVAMLCRENLAGMKVIRAFLRESYVEKQINEELNQQKALQIKVGKMTSYLNPMTMFVVNIAIIILLYIGGLRVDGGQLTQGEVIALIQYLNQMFMSVLVLSQVIVILNKARVSDQRIQDVFNTKSSIQDGECEVQLQHAPVIQFDQVFFQYGKSHVLKSISFQVNKGETIGIIGGIGSGKSSLVQLLLRFYDCSQGQILFYGKPLEMYALSSLKAAIGLVPQEAVLFQGTIRDNMQWGKEDASDACIYNALKMAQADFVFALADGLDTHVTKEGMCFSGGQRQRLTIARALVKQPELLILDESTSALDLLTETDLMNALQALDITTLMVSKRVSHIQKADRILVLNHGELVGVGNHQELLKTCHIYQDIVASQMPDEVTL